MFKLNHLFQILMISSLVVCGTAGAAEAANEKDPIRAALLESKEKNKGVTIHVSGNNIAMVVTGLDEKHVAGRSQQASRIIIRLDRIDGVSGSF